MHLMASICRKLPYKKHSDTPRWCSLQVYRIRFMCTKRMIHTSYKYRYTPYYSTCTTAQPFMWCTKILWTTLSAPSSSSSETVPFFHTPRVDGDGAEDVCRRRVPAHLNAFNVCVCMCMCTCVEVRAGVPRKRAWRTAYLRLAGAFAHSLADGNAHRTTAQVFMYLVCERESAWWKVALSAGKQTHTHTHSVGVDFDL